MITPQRGYHPSRITATPEVMYIHKAKRINHIYPTLTKSEAYACAAPRSPMGTSAWRALAASSARRLCVPTNAKMHAQRPKTMLPWKMSARFMFSGGLASGPARSASSAAGAG